MLTIHATFGNVHVHPTPKRSRIDTIREKKGLKRLQKEANALQVKPSCSETQNDKISPRKANLYDTEAFAKHQRTHNKRLNHKSLIILFFTLMIIVLNKWSFYCFIVLQTQLPSLTFANFPFQKGANISKPVDRSLVNSCTIASGDIV